MEIRLFDRQGNRKYLTPSERHQFKAAAFQVSNRACTFCLMLCYSGCRISEALQLKVKNIDFAAGAVVIETLKQRKPGVFRQIPLPDEYLKDLNLVFDLKALQKKRDKLEDRIWSWSRKHGYVQVMDTMRLAGLEGIHATPRGLRHGFAIACIDKGIPLNLIQKWMGHAHISTTAIYANAMGEEERKIASRLWED